MSLDLISHYEVLAKVGEGGMGVVYKARDTQLNRFVALKMLPEAKAADQERRERFLHEARSASALNLPNIVTIYDVIRHGDAEVIVMEFVKGKTLAEVIPRKGLRTGEVLRYAVQIADALAAAHEAGIIHRDLKPGNIIVAENGHAEILDFGLAKVTESAAAAGAGEETRTLGPRTQEGAILGTAAYMSPEQAEGRPVDARSDVFSFGTVLYEMITGDQPFRGESNMATMAAILNREPPALPAETPHDLAMIATRCLRKYPARRFHHMIDIKLALQDLKEMSESGTLFGVAPTPARRRRVWPWAAAAGFLVLAAAGVAWYVARSAREPAPLTMVPLTSYPGEETMPALSPDGNLVAFSWNGPNGDNSDIYVLQIGGGPPLRLTTHSAVVVFPVWSPDGRQIAFLRGAGSAEQGVFAVPALGGPERRMADPGVAPARPSLAWSRDGKYLVCTYQSALWRVSVESGEKRQLTAPVKANDAGPEFASPADLVFFRYAGWENGDLYRLPLSRDGTPRGEPERLTTDSRLILGAAAAPGGRIVFSSNRGGSRALWTIRPGSEPVKFAAGDNGAFPSTCISRNRLLYAEQNNDTNLWVLDASGKQPPRRIVASTREDSMGAYSPDDKRIAFASMRSGNWEIWAAGADGSNPVQLTNLAGPPTIHPSWSPDGKRILFDSVQGDRRDIHVMRADGGPIQRLTSEAAENLRARWSPDGQWIYFCSNRSGTPQIWRMPGGGGPAVQITRKGGREAYLSPDGKLVYFLRQSEKGIFSMPAEGGEEKKVLEIGELDRWAVTGAGLYVLDRNTKPRATIVSYDFGTRQLRRVIELPDELRANSIVPMTVSHDGRSILLTHRDRAGSDLVLVENFR